MKRKVLTKLIEWNNKADFKPLILNGARQVGKTWLMNEFATLFYPNNHVYINFEDEVELKNLFLQDFNIRRIEATIMAAKEVKIDDNTLFLFDELQEAARGCMALKYFYEKTPQRRIMAAGSMLGLSLHNNDSFPVGKVSIIDVYPLDFEEYLWATGNESLDSLIIEKNWEVLNTLKFKCISLLKMYYFVGGMPRVVKEYIDTNDLNQVRQEQKELLASYELDFSKHAPANEVPRIRMVWNSVPTQLSKENRKFIYGALKSGARAKDFEIAIEWLKDAGLIYQVNRISNAELPLKGYAEMDAFKVFLLDIGLLCAQANLSPKVIVDADDLFMTYRGALTEQYVYQQICPNQELGIYYWSADNSKGEVDFVTDDGRKILPIEVKAAENLQSKSLKAFTQKYHLKDALRFSLSDFRKQEWLTNVPLYAVCQYMKP